jgi:hypothetical protein
MDPSILDEYIINYKNIFTHDIEVLTAAVHPASPWHMSQ